MNLIFYIGQGIGLAAAAGLRPFLPALLAGALASGDVFLEFDHTDYSFLQNDVFLLAVVLVAATAFLLQRRFGSELMNKGKAAAVVDGLGLGLGAVLFAAVLAQHHDLAWPGLIGGLLCAGLAQLATRGLLSRARARLKQGAERDAVAAYTDAASLVLAALAVFAGPISFVAVGLFGRLLWGERRRSGEKFAGLRVLR
jgi:hypothetical protein